MSEAQNNRSRPKTFPQISSTLLARAESEQVAGEAHFAKKRIP